MSATVTSLGAFHLTEDEGLEGWCWYPDRPEERAIVELLIDGKVVRAARATRFLQNRRDLGTGDGYCGFWFPLPSELGRNDGRSVLEVRERLFGQIFGRVVIGGMNRAGDIRLSAVESRLGSVSTALNDAGERFDLGAPFGALGRTLLRGRQGVPGLGACLERMEAIPRVDLNWSPAPAVSIIVPAVGAEIGALAALLRDASRALAHLGAEFILLDDGSQPLAFLLPTRLRYLQLVREAAMDQPGKMLNAAVALARGPVLAVARQGGPHLAGLAEAVGNARPGMLHWNRPGPKLQLVVSRQDLYAMGGFDPHLAGEALWLDLLAKASVLGLHVHV